MEKFISLIEELSSTNSANSKKEILKFRGDNCIEQLNYALDPFKVYNFTSKFIEEQAGSDLIAWSDMKSLLDKLASRELTGNKAKIAVNLLLANTQPVYIDIFKKIVDKDLKAGVTAKTINKVLGNIVPEFSCQLCDKYIPEKHGLPYDITFSSRKLDGCRTLAIKEDDGFHFYSRSGKEFFTLGKVKEELDKLFSSFPKQVFDGEICIVDEEGNEDFTKVVSEIRMKNHTIENPKLIIFDVIRYEDFLAKKSNESFSFRLGTIDGCKEKKGKYFDFLEQTKVESEDHLSELIKEANTKGWEGLILRDGLSLYEGKRTKKMLKVKKFHDAEFTIIGVEQGEKGSQFENTLGALVAEGVVDGKQVKFNVGSGLTEDARKDLWSRKEEIIGHDVAIQYFEVSKDKEGNHSLRFPVFKHIYSGNREV